MPTARQELHADDTEFTLSRVEPQLRVIDLATLPAGNLSSEARFIYTVLSALKEDDLINTVTSTIAHYTAYSGALIQVKLRELVNAGYCKLDGDGGLEVVGDVGHE